MRVVLDTNVLARALPGRNNAAELALLAVCQPPHALIASDFLLDELERVLRYDRQRRIHGFDDAQIDAFVDHIRQAAVVVLVPAAAADAVVLSDPDDDPIVATAVLGQADVLCTWDRHLYQPAVVQYLHQFRVRVMREGDLLAELRQPGSSQP
jgi:putative PIN family toxin of toxin-antitoxin system